MAGFTVAYTEPSGYKFVETSPDVKALAAGFPCFKPIEWPDYDTKVIDVEINGKPRVIQLWKGWCQQMYSSPLFPGGIGGEVGIYERLKGREMPAEKPDFMPGIFWEALKAASKKAPDSFWWPVTDDNEVEFNFINPVNNKIVFHAGPQKTYWRNKWMDTSSFHDYRKSTGKKNKWLPVWWPKNTQTPNWAVNYIMEYKINGHTYPRW
ncbi:MAG TPA: hypothetical protein VLL54_10810 [Pyrinomonadaceae bacterium]|nr:hypothetical protein [Pyrinomonadaceae bacterium]